MVKTATKLKSYLSSKLYLLILDTQLEDNSSLSLAMGLTAITYKQPLMELLAMSSPIR